MDIFIGDFVQHIFMSMHSMTFWLSTDTYIHMLGAQSKSKLYYEPIVSQLSQSAAAGIRVHCFVAFIWIESNCKNCDKQFTFIVRVISRPIFSSLRETLYYLF